MSINLSNQEKIILDLVQEYLNKNRYFNIKKIIPFINYRLRNASIDLNYNGIEAILKTLLNKRLILEGSKLTRNDILLNSKRRKIYEFIIKNQVVYFNKIVKRLNLNNHVVIWHLDMLIEFNFIKKEKIDNRELYYDPSMKVDEIKKIYFLSNKNCKRIINYLKKNNSGIFKSKISQDLNMHLYTANKYLNILKQYEIISLETYSNKKLYFLNERYIDDGYNF